MNRPDFTDKSDVREYYLKQRNRLADKDVEIKSKLISEKLIGLKIYLQANTIHSYVSIDKNKEVNTHQLIETSFEKNKSVVVPKIRNGGKLEHIQIQSLSGLKINNWGIPEPVHKKYLPLPEIDIVIVPMVAGDKKKNRIGYGKGYYDRFLSEIDAFKIGLLFDCQLSEIEIPTQSFDVSLDMLITESQQIV